MKQIKKFWPIFLFFFLIFTFTIKTASALTQGPLSGYTTDLRNYDFYVNFYRPGFSSGDPQSQNVIQSKNVSVSIKAYNKGSATPLTNFFRSSSTYYYLLTTPSGLKCTTLTHSYSGTLVVGSDSDLAATIFPYEAFQVRATQCKSLSVTGTWKFDLWKDNPSPGNNYMLKDVPLVVGPPQTGTNTSIGPVNGTLICQNVVTSVLLSNGRANTTYFFWWKGDSRRATASEVRINTDGENRIVDLIGNSSLTGKVGARLCMRPNTVAPPDPDTQCDSTNAYIDYTFSNDPLCGNDTNEPTCTYSTPPVLVGTAKKKILITGTNFPTDTGDYRGDLFNKATGTNTSFNDLVAQNKSVVVDTGEQPAGEYAFYFYRKTDSETPPRRVCTIDPLTVGTTIDSGLPPLKGPRQCNADGSGGAPKCSKSAGIPCDYIAEDGSTKQGIGSALGCIPTQPADLVRAVLRVALFAAGGIALLLMIFGSIQMISSAGNPETLKKGQEQFISAIMGLLFIIFASLLLQFIGYNILSVPGFGS